MKIEGISEFKEYLKSPHQQLCGRNFKIGSSWDFNLPIINIGVKYFPVSPEEEIDQTQKYGQIKFTLEGGKITSLVYKS